MDRRSGGHHRAETGGGLDYVGGDTMALQHTPSTDKQWLQDLKNVRDELNVAMHQAGVDPDGEKVIERRRIRASTSPIPPSGIFDTEDVRRQHALDSGYALQPSEDTRHEF